LHCLVIGPGLGRCPLVMKAVAQILVEARRRHLHVVLDADALFMLSLPEYRDILSGYDKAVLTPNAVEYLRLFPPTQASASAASSSKVVGGEEEEEVAKSAHLKDVTIVRKGKEDVVMVVQDDDDNDSGENNEQQQHQQQQISAAHLTCSEPGGLKRSGGIGDVLAGTLGTMLAWHSILVKQRGGGGGLSILPANGDNNNDNINNDLSLSCWTACCFVKRATYKAFQAKRRSMTAPDVLEALGPSIDEMTN
jgi:ATP-dependent NAD(P)H-hydrate dehydratase